ncbi:hypothetical protein ACLOJK_035648 [Asimina triloba]
MAGHRVNFGPARSLALSKTSPFSSTQTAKPLRLLALSQRLLGRGETCRPIDEALPNTKTSTLGNPTPATRRTKRYFSSSSSYSSSSSSLSLSVHRFPYHQLLYLMQELGGKFRPYSDITGVCARCKDQIEWKRRDVLEVEAERKIVDEAIKNARERDRRTLIRAVRFTRRFLILLAFDQMNKEKSSSAVKVSAVGDRSREGDIFPVSSIVEYAKLSGCDNSNDEDKDNDNEDEEDAEREEGDDYADEEDDNEDAGGEKDHIHN